MNRKKALALTTIFFICCGFAFSFVYLLQEEQAPDIQTDDIDTLWSYMTGDIVESSAAIADIDGDGQQEVVIGSSDNFVYAFDGVDGNVLWSYPTRSDITSSPTIADLDNDGSIEVIVSSEDGNVYALNGEDGSTYWTPSSVFEEIEGTLSGEGAQERYTIHISEGAYSLRCVLTCGDNDYDLYIGFDSEPTIDDYDYRGYSTTGEDETVTYPQAGDWHIMINSYSGGGTFLLSISVEYGGAVNEDTTEFDGTLTETGDYDYHTITIPSGVVDVHCILSGGDNDFDLYGKYGSQPTTSDYDWRGYATGMENFHLSDLTPGLWHIMVHSYSGSGSYQLIIKITHEGTFDANFQGPIESSPVVADLNGDNIQDVVVGSTTSSVRALHGLNGSALWEFTTSSAIISSPALGDVNNDGSINVLICDSNGLIYCLDGENGIQIWQQQTDGNSPTTPVLLNIDDDPYLEIIIGDSNGVITAFDGLDGGMQWSLNTGSAIESSPALGDLDNDEILEVVFGTADGTIVSINCEDGSWKWSFAAGSQISNSISIADISGDGGLDVVFGNTDGLIALDGEDGSLIWSVPTPGPIISAPVIGDLDLDGILNIVVGCSNHAVYSLMLQRSGQRIFWQALGGTADFTRVGSIAYIDQDNDMLSSYSESAFSSNPHSNDSDSDNIPDALEISLGLSPVFSDTDFDNIDDYTETYIYLTNGSNPDSDNDLLSDSLEINVYHTSPLSNDTDFDTLSDGLEILVYGSDPLVIDSDNDSIRDGDEVYLYGSSPSLIDTDFDLISDYDEIFLYGTHPNMTDSDEDGLWDYYEIMEHDTDPLIADSDQDGALDGLEINEMATDPNVFDSDGDSYSDGWEHFAGFDPLSSEVPLAQVLVFNFPFVLVGLIVLMGGIIFLYRKRVPVDEQYVPIRQEPPEPKKPTPTVKYDLMDDVDKPWLYDDKQSLLA
ncbi:MAG: outer membrane protein assembly factor BamB family protein, partial [Candidatus Thorarchaeota archaeon]